MSPENREPPFRKEVSHRSGQVAQIPPDRRLCRTGISMNVLALKKCGIWKVNK